MSQIIILFSKEQDPFEKFQSTKEDSFSFNFPDHEENEEIIKFYEMIDRFLCNHNRAFEEIHLKNPFYLQFKK